MNPEAQLMPHGGFSKTLPLPVLHRRIEDGCDPALVQANDPDLSVGVKVFRAVSPMDEAREMIFFERGPVRAIEAPDATLVDDNRAIQFLKTLDDAPSNLDVRTDFQVEI